MLRAAQRFMAEPPGFRPRNLRQLFTVFCSELLHELSPERRSRVFPRTVKRKMSNWLLRQVPRPVKQTALGLKLTIRRLGRPLELPDFSRLNH